MIKDKEQKQLALKFCAAQGIVPFMEVIVRSQTGVEETPVDITDIDVFGVDLGPFGATQRIVFDCKSGAKLSAVNRALWAAGLKSFVEANRAYVIQKREVPYSHKIAANSLQVSVHSEESFKKYASSITTDFLKDVSYLDDLKIWDEFLTLSQTQPALKDLLWFSTTQAALERSAPRGIRVGLSALISVAPELDPKKPLHCFCLANAISSFMIFCSLSSTTLKELFQFSMAKEDFERVVRYFIWEGRENYLNRRQMKAAIDKAKGITNAQEFDLPEWARFLQLMRSFLDAPESLTKLPYLMKEIAFRWVSGARPDPDQSLRSLFNSNARSRQFIFACVTYVVAAAKLPKEFSTLIESQINGLLAAIPQQSPAPEAPPLFSGKPGTGGAF
jgi:hypothetical protein